MRRALDGGWELDDDPARVDVDALHAFLSQRSYWARGRTRGEVEASLGAAVRIVGLYHREQMIGFARALRADDGSLRLADVYVLDAHRGRGLGVELVREIVDRGPLREQAWSLRTADAQGLYRRFGFREEGEMVPMRDEPPRRYQVMVRPATSASGPAEPDAAGDHPGSGAA